MTIDEQRSAEIELNPEQRAAVEHGEGPLLVVAGAGTGKTRVIVERIRHLLDSDPVLTGEGILGLTFTEKAAAEMKYRVMRLAGERAEGITLSTFHAFCVEKVLKELNPELQVLDDVDYWILLRKNLARLRLEKFRRLAEPGQFLSDFCEFFSRCQDELITPEDYERYVEGLRAQFQRSGATLDPEGRRATEEELARQEELARVYRVSEELLRERNFITFGGQLQQAVHRLQADAALREKLRSRYLYILVDEFQDTNIAQLELLWQLAGGHRNILAVGDDDQAIYRFRGASFGSFTIFLERFCGVHGAGGRYGKLPMVSLRTNYRSTERILRVAGKVIELNEKSSLLPAKRLVTENPEGERIRIVEFGHPEEEAHWVASEIERMHTPARPWKSFAVLYRKHSHRDSLIEALRQRRIPFVIRRFSILSSTLVRDLIAYLRWIAYPADNVACARVLGIPYWRLAPRDVQRLAERAARVRGRSIFEAAESAGAEAKEAGSGPRYREFAEFLEDFRKRSRKMTAAALLNELIDALGIAPLPSDADRYYLARLVRFVQEWEKKSDAQGLRDFIQYLDYFAEAGGDIALDEEPGEDGVQLMTVHTAKGLEFPYVFIIALSNNEFPARPQSPVFEFPAELMKEEKPKGDFRIQEERRLFYVALTRARRNLTLTTVINKRRKASPFLEDILMEPAIKAKDAVQMSPQVAVPESQEVAGAPPADAARPQLFGPGPRDSRAYSQIALWAKAYHPPLPEPLQLSASAIDTYLSCPMKFLFQRAWGIRGSQRAMMAFGNVMHRTIREFVSEARRRREIPFEEAAVIYNREWTSVGYLDDYQEEEYRREGLLELENFCRSYLQSRPDVLFQEKAFELPLENDIVITGRMDQVNRLSGRNVEIIDYKTGSAKKPREAKESLQLSLYALAALEVLELNPARLVFHNLATNEAIATTRDAKELARAKEKVAEAADLIRAGDYPAKPGFACRRCDYKLLCPAHEQLITISTAAGAGRASIAAGRK